MQSDDNETIFRRRRHRLIQHLRGEGIENEAVLEAMENTPRHRFIEEKLSGRAYENRPLSIGEGQTISQPYIVALMTEMLLGGETELASVLEIGTGCGYQTAILAQLVGRVFTVERIPGLQGRARELLPQLGFHNVEYLSGDGFEGWEAHQPFDGILVTAAPIEVPQKLLEQLGCGGRLVIPVGDDHEQHLRIITRSDGGFDEQRREAVRFVPMLHGRAN